MARNSQFKYFLRTRSAVGALIVVLTLVAATARSQPALGLPAPTLSSSRQFVVLATPGAQFPRDTFKDPNLIYLEPALLAVTCERIKSALYEKLELQPDWRGRVYLQAVASQSPLDTVTVVGEHFPSGWNYRMQIPNPLPRERFVHAIVGVLLTEMANRDGGTHSAEVPDWLAVGLTREVMAERDKDFLLPQSARMSRGQPVLYTLNEERRVNPLQSPRNLFDSQPPLTFDELSWPSVEDMDGARHEAFGASAQLLTDRLLQLPGGIASIRAFLGSLPQYYNWQVPFLTAFQNYFQRPVDVEKWWALQTVAFTERDLTNQTWTTQASLDDLSEALLTPIHVRLGTNDLPETTEVLLQTIIREWSRDEQIQGLESRQHELEMLRLRLAPDPADLLDGYRLVIANYLKELKQPRYIPPPRPNHLSGPVRVAVRQLDGLDAKRQAMRVAERKQLQEAQARPGS